MKHPFTKPASSSPLLALTLLTPTLGMMTLPSLVIAQQMPQVQQTSQAASNAKQQAFDIPAGSLGQALNEFAQQANIAISFSAKFVEGRRSDGLSGELSVQEGLNKLLSGSGLTAMASASGYRVEYNNNRVMTLEAVTFSEESMASTEGTGSAEDGYLVSDITGVGPWGERSLQNTPYQVSVVSEDLIQNVQANDMAQIFKMNPITQDGGDQPGSIYQSVIRGFSSNNAVINGMPMANYYSFAVMEDLERVEVINGATGFLYGGGRVGGAVNYVTKKPTIEDKRTITVGNYGGNQYYGNINLSGQIDEENIFGYRINTLYQDGDSVAGVNKEQKFVSLAFDYKPTDNFIMDLKYVHRELERSNQKMGVWLSAGATRPTIDVSENYSPDWIATDEENDRLSTSLMWDINDIFSVRSSLLYEESYRALIGSASRIVREDGLYDAYPYKYPSKGQQYENWSGNLYLDSKFNTLGVDHFLTVGYSENSYTYFRTDIWGVSGNSLTGVSLEEIRDADESSTIIEDSPINPGSKSQYKNILIGDDITFNDQWSALLGVNYATVIQTSYNQGIETSKYDKSALTPTLSLIYKPIEDLTTYATYMESLEAGTIVGDTYSNAGEVLAPLVSTQYEIGAKYSFSDYLLLSSALFRIEKANQYSDNATPMPKYVQDGEQVHQGLELTITGKASDNLTIIAGGTLMDLSVEKSNNPDLIGKKPTNAASEMAKIYAEYNIPQINGLTVTGGAYYTGEKYGDSVNTDKIPSYTLFDAGLRYQVETYPATFNLTLTNLTGEDYWASSSILGDPRSVSFSMKMDF